MEATFQCRDGKKLFLRSWVECEAPACVLLGIHGMSEHSGRYEDFGRYLNDNGILLYMPDTRAHGNTEGDVAKIGLGYRDLYPDTVGDFVELTDYLREKYPRLPLFVFGHSYGSILCQGFLERRPNVDGAVICGSQYFDSLTNRLGLAVAKLQCLFCGEKSRAKLIARLSFGAYGKRFDRGNWLTRDEAAYDEYLQNPYNTQTFSAGFYYSLCRNGTKLYKKENSDRIDRDLPIFVICGGNDPFGDNGRLPRKLAAFYRQIGVKDVTFRCYAGGRHEILNETNKEEVYADIVAFLKGHMPQELARGEETPTETPVSDGAAEANSEA